MSRSENVWQPYPADRKPEYRPAGVVTDTDEEFDTITLAVQDSREWPHEEHSHTSATIRPALGHLADRNGIIYASTGDAHAIKSILGRAGIPDALLLDQRNGGHYVTDRETRQPIALLVPGLPPIWFLPPLRDLSPRVRAAEVFAFLDWAWAHGVAAGDPDQMTFNSWKITFPPRGFKTWFYPDAHSPGRPPRDLYVTGAEADRVVQLPLLGRDQAPQWTLGFHEHATLYDRKMAYPYEMAHGGPFPMQLHRAHPADRLPEAWEVGIVQVVIHHVPEDLLWSPVPCYFDDHGRKRWSYEKGTAPDVLTIRELWLALTSGVDLEIKETYACPASYYKDNVFTEWFGLCVEARELEHGSRVAKWIANRLWGQLSRMDDFLPWAVEITARHRVTAARQALMVPEVRAVYAETDGIICTAEDPAARPEPYGDGPGKWREKPKDGPADQPALILGESAYMWDRGNGKFGYHAETAAKDRPEHCRDLGDKLVGNDPRWLAWRPLVERDIRKN